MIAIDWSHTKELTTFDGKKVRVEDKRTLIKRLKKARGESPIVLKSTTDAQPLAVLEQGCPMSLLYSLTSQGISVSLISNRATQDYRTEYNVEKTDENDAKIIYKLSNDGASLEPISLDASALQMHDLYHQYCRFQKARVSMQNMKKAHSRQYGDGLGESIRKLESIPLAQPDLSPYDTAIDVLHKKEKSLLKSLVAGGESNTSLQSTPYVQPPTIRGLGKRIWVGLMVTADPADFKCLSAYLRFCGLTADVIESHKYNRHARMLYHTLAVSVMRQRDSVFRPIYDKCKSDLAEKFPDYPKYRINNMALNRTATFLAKHIYGTKGVRSGFGNNKGSQVSQTLLWREFIRGTKRS